MDLLGLVIQRLYMLLEHGLGGFNLEIDSICVVLDIGFDRLHGRDGVGHLAFPSTDLVAQGLGDGVRRFRQFHLPVMGFLVNRLFLLQQLVHDGLGLFLNGVIDFLGHAVNPIRVNANDRLLRLTVKNRSLGAWWRRL